MWGRDETFDFGGTCAACSHGSSPGQERVDGLKIGSALLGACRDADSIEILPTVPFQPLSLEQCLLVPAVPERDAGPSVRRLRGINTQRP